jgi:hypothetical protein
VDRAVDRAVGGQGSGQGSGGALPAAASRGHALQMALQARLSGVDWACALLSATLGRLARASGCCRRRLGPIAARAASGPKTLHVVAAQPDWRVLVAAVPATQSACSCCRSRRRSLAGAVRSGFVGLRLQVDGRGPMVVLARCDWLVAATPKSWQLTTSRQQPWSTLNEAAPGQSGRALAAALADAQSMYTVVR